MDRFTGSNGPDADTEAFVGSLKGGETVRVGCAVNAEFVRWHESDDERADVRIGTALVVVWFTDLSRGVPVTARTLPTAATVLRAIADALTWQEDGQSTADAIADALARVTGEIMDDDIAAVLREVADA